MSAIYHGFATPPQSTTPTAGPIYLDYNATTPIDPRVAKAMLPYLCKHWGNPSSSHVYGQAAKQGVEHARQQVAKAIGASNNPDSVLFTSGGTESANHAIKGAVELKRIALLHSQATTSSQTSSQTTLPLGHTNFSWGTAPASPAPPPLPHVITSITEHPCVLQTCQHLADTGKCTVTVLNVNDIGQIDLLDVKNAMRKETALVTIMHANNESGVVQDICSIAKVARETSTVLGGEECGGVLIHTDASQSMGKVQLDVQAMGVDLLTLAGHKVYAPKGVGCLYMKDNTLPVFMHGAGHENGRRAGTENVLLLAGFGEGCEMATEANESRHLATMAQLLHSELEQLCMKEEDGVTSRLRINGPPLDAGNQSRLPNTVNIGFKGITSDALMNGTQGTLAFSAASACHQTEGHEAFISPVIRAMGTPTAFALGSIRLSVGRYTTSEEVKIAARALSTVANEHWSQSTAATALGKTGDSVDSSSSSSSSSLPSSSPFSSTTTTTTTSTTPQVSTSVATEYPEIMALPGTIPMYWTDTWKCGNYSSTFMKTVKEIHPKTKQEYTAVVTASTIFHPQGGGQPSDIGTLTSTTTGAVFNVTMVASGGPSHPAGTILHIGTFASNDDGAAASFQVGDAIAMQVDETNRRACARSHSAGHLLDQAMARAGMNMKGLKGFHFLQGSYVEFDGAVPANERGPLKEQLQTYMNELVAECVPTRILWVKTLEELTNACLPGAGCNAECRLEQGPVRVVQVGGTGGCPCGGTHVANSSEIGKVTVTKIKVKKGVTKVSYKIE